MRPLKVTVTLSQSYGRKNPTFNTSLVFRAHSTESCVQFFLVILSMDAF